MGTLTYLKPNGEWGIEGVDLSMLPPKVYGALCKLCDLEHGRIVVMGGDPAHSCGSGMGGSGTYIVNGVVLNTTEEFTEQTPRTRWELLRGMDVEDAGRYFNRHLICPPGTPTTDGCPYLKRDCDGCWIRWLEGVDDDVD